jgi:DNA-binding PadR family transcriptional regulator
MVREGLLASGSPVGIWEITEKGKQYLREHGG